MSIRSDGAAIELYDLPKLKVLDASNNSVSDKSFVGIDRLTSLETLHLKGCNRIGNDTLTKVGTLSHLKELDLSLTRVTNEGISKLSNLHELRYLNIASTSADNQALAHLKHLRELRFVEFPKPLTDLPDI